MANDHWNLHIVDFNLPVSDEDGDREHMGIARAVVLNGPLLPVILAGGGFKHGQHLAFNRPYLDELKQELNPAPGSTPNAEKKIPLMGHDQQPLCNLYTSMLQQGGVEIDRFSTATSTLTGLE